MTNNQISAVIPVKGNSTRLPNKNILPFGNLNLLTHKIQCLKKTKGLKEIIVSSDSDIMLKMAENCGVKAILRPKEFADETRPFADFIDYISNIVSGEHLLWGCCTSPFVDDKLFNRAIEAYYQALQEGYDSLITVLPFQHFLLNENGPMNFGIGKKHKNSQFLPKYDFFTNGVVLAPIKVVKELHYNFGNNPYRYRVTQKEAIDIDTEFDYTCARLLKEAEILHDIS